MEDDLRRDLWAIAGLSCLVWSGAGCGDSGPGASASDGQTLVVDSVRGEVPRSDGRPQDAVSLEADAAETWGQDIPVYPAEVDVTVEHNPLAFRFAHDGKPMTALASQEGSALFVMSGGKRIDITCGDATSMGSDQALACMTDDGREVQVRLGPREEGAFRLQVVVEGKSQDERIGLAFEVGPTEGFYGLMERVVQGDQDKSWASGTTAGLNLRGQEVLLFVLPTVSLYSPFYVSTAGYGVYVESDWPGTYRFGLDGDEAVTVVYEGPEVAVRLFPGPGPLDAVARYSRTVGTTLLPPSWVFGPWRWRDDVWDLAEFYDGSPAEVPFNSMVVEDVLMMEALGIPCTLYWVDRPWAEGPFGYDDFDWDEDRLPNPEAMVQWLAARETKFMLWIAPWAVGKMADEAVQLGYTVTSEMPWAMPAYAKLLDLTNPDAVSWWQKHLAMPIGDGVAGFKLDRGEEKVPDGFIVTGQYFDGTSYREGHNRYPALYAQAVHDAFVSAGVEEFAVMPRAGWVSTSHHAVVWGGDTSGTEWGLRSAIIAVQRAASMNFPIWGSDTCGYDQLAPREVCARWLAFSAFTPLMEVGPTGNAAFWSLPPDGEECQVSQDGYGHLPTYDEFLVAVWVMYARLHADLSPYTQQQAQTAHDSGVPIVRPMALSFPGVGEYAALYDQYLFGPDLLVAPVWKQGQEVRSVSIPEGSWVDAWTGETVVGPVVLPEYPIPQHLIPIFVREGADVPFGDLAERWAEAQEAAATHPDISSLAAAQSW